LRRLTRFAEDSPGGAGLKLKLVDQVLEHSPNVIVLTDMRDHKLCVLHSLFGFEVEDVHPTK
jgi:hypothetical protein